MIYIAILLLTAMTSCQFFEKEIQSNPEEIKILEEVAQEVIQAETGITIHFPAIPPSDAPKP